MSNLKTYCKDCHEAIHSGEKMAPTAEGYACLPSFELQGGELIVFEDFIQIMRSSASNFSDKSIRTEDIRDVRCNFGLLSGYIQIMERGVESAESGILTHPSGENTLYYPRTKRALAQEAREVILNKRK